MQQAIRRSFFPTSQMTKHFVEVKADYAKEMVTGFLKLNGTTVGAVANRTEVYGADGEKAEEFEAVLTARGCKKGSKICKIL